MVQETKGDTVAPGAEGLLVQPDDCLSTWGWPQQLHGEPGRLLGAQATLPTCPMKSYLMSGPSSLGSALTACCAHSPRTPTLPRLPGLH